MGHLKGMTDRLPPLYREGVMIGGSRELGIGGTLGAPSLQLEILDELALGVKRSHEFQSTLDLEEAEKLAAVLDIEAEAWHTLDTFRGWVHSLRDARVKHGAVTPEGIRAFVDEFTDAFLEATTGLAMPLLQSGAVWVREASDSHRALVENPRERVTARAPASGSLEPLARFTIVNKGLDQSAAGFLLVGLASGPEYVPVIANLTTRHAVVFLGEVPPGARLWVRALSDGTLQAELDNKDVSNQLRSVAGFEPGEAWSVQDAVGPPARAGMLARGENDLWFLPVAHFDQPGLDRVLLALASLDLRQGVYDETRFDQSLFHQDAAAMLHVAWMQSTPATFEVHLPAGAMLTGREGVEGGLAARSLLEYSVDRGVKKLRAAGVRSRVRLRDFSETQAQRDALLQVLPVTFREGGSMGADAVPDAGGLFSVTGFDDSTFR